MDDMLDTRKRRPGRRPYYGGVPMKQVTAHMPEPLERAVKDEVLAWGVRDRDPAAWNFSRVVNRILMDYFDMEFPQR